jgi:hypothetical protein
LAQDDHLLHVLHGDHRVTRFPEQDARHGGQLRPEDFASGPFPPQRPVSLPVFDDKV